MKFSNALRFNSAAEWWDKYIDYAGLKRHIYAIEKAQHQSEAHVNERSALIAGGTRGASANDMFIPLLDAELLKICNFYEAQEAALLQELDELIADIEHKDGDPSRLSMTEESEDEDEDEDEHNFSGVEDGSPKRERHEREDSMDILGQLSGDGLPNHMPTSAAEAGRPRALSANAADLELGMSSSPTRHRRTDSSPHTDSRSRSGHNPFGSILRSITSNMSDNGNLQDIWTSNSDHAWDVRLVFKRRITSLYISFTSLKSYVQLNFTGFTKILKKYDKVNETELKSEYLRTNVETALPFQARSKNKVSDAINTLIGLYAKCVTKGDVSLARRQLRLHQREHIVWERDTVWRQMIGRERRGEGNGLLTAIDATSPGDVGAAWFKVWTPFGGFGVTTRLLMLLISLLIFLVLLNSNMFEDEAESNCLAILVFCTLLWASEAIPLFVTSMLVPLLVVLLRVVKSDDDTTPGSGQRLSAVQATRYIFSVMFSPTIMLLIGGFTIASALSKSNIDRLIVTRVLSLAGTRPSIVLLAFMGVACFASMWISNVAAPTLCFSLITPILRNLPPHSNFAPCVILGIALAANIGGQSSPISSPQNLIALGAMEPPVSWLEWFAIALPVSGISIVVIWLLLLVSYRPTLDAEGNQLEIRPIRGTKDSFTATQYFITFVTLSTITLWLFEHMLESRVGDMGIIALIPVIAFFGAGVLKKADFENFLWTVVFLAMGGIALGRAVVSSGLIDSFDQQIRFLISGLKLYEVVLMLSVLVLVVSTFISHTIASVLLVPIAAEVGQRLAEPHPRLLIMLTALLCSTGMGMPVSGFPNQTAANQEDEFGKPYLTNVDFLKNGVPASIIAAVVVATVGYLMMRVFSL